jgi:hypothetical protein
MPAPSLASLERRQRAAFRIGLRTPLRTPKDAEVFLAAVGLALRYHGKDVAIASLRAAAGPESSKAALVASIELTNHLLATRRAIEVNVIADRLVLVHRSLMPALYALVRQGRAIDDLSGLSLPARGALALLRQRREVSAGDVRRHLGLAATARQDPAYDALGELQRVLLVDRGPAEIPATGIPYLSPEGYPYHLFQDVHADLVSAAAKYSADAAADRLLSAYLAGAAFATPRRLASLFRRVLTADDVRAAVERLTARRRVAVHKIGRDTVVVGVAHG